MPLYRSRWQCLALVRLPVITTFLPRSRSSFLPLQRYSLIHQPYPLIVPGGRFVESYYWDSYWVIQGLLRCGMTATAQGVALNLVHMLDTFGFVPNGGRVYYAMPGRSQVSLTTELSCCNIHSLSSFTSSPLSPLHGVSQSDPRSPCPFPRCLC